MTDIEIPLEDEKDRVYRLFEILPGAFSWSIILLPAVLAFVNATAAAYFVIAFMTAWLVKAVSMSIRVIQGYKRLDTAINTDWQARLEDLHSTDKALALYKERKSLSREEQLHYKNLCHFASHGEEESIDPADIYHAVIIAAYNEPLEVVELTVKAVADSKYDSKKMFLILAYEQRGGADIQRAAEDLIHRYGHTFKHAMAVKHPDGLKNEVIGKGGNITYAGREFAKYAENEGINYKNVIVTTLDSDNRPHPSYFAHLSYMYAIDPERKYKSFQPIPMFMNNIWDVPAPMRILATGNSFWNLIVSVRPHLMRNFAAHAQSLQALQDTDFWSTRTIVEDGHQFWRTYFRYDGKHEVVPMYVPVYQDAVLDETYRKTLKAQFIQLRRWAWGASDIAFLVTKGFFVRNAVDKRDLFFKTLRLFEAHISWATVPLVLASAGWFPILLNPDGQDSIVAHQLPSIAAWLNSFIAVGILITVFLSAKVLPPRPSRYKVHRHVFMYLQWILMPISSIVYGAVTALYSQTRLMFGRYLDKFDVTKKVVKH